MGRLIFIALIVLAVWWLVRRIKAGARQTTPGPRQSSRGRVLPCSQCGVYVPEQDAIRAGERVFCSSGHLTQFERDQE